MIQDFKNLRQDLFSSVCCGILLTFMILFISCSRPKIYKSQCDERNGYQKIELNELLRNFESYDGKFVEVEGVYKSGFEESAIYDNSFYFQNDKKNALWVDFNDLTLRCPLLSLKTKLDLFRKEVKNNPMHNMAVTRHGRINVKQKGHLSEYNGEITDITFVKIQ